MTILFNPLPQRRLLMLLQTEQTQIRQLSADPDQAALRELPDQGLLCLLTEI